MPNTKEEQFRKACEARALDTQGNVILQAHLENYRQAFQNLSPRFQNLQNAKKKAHLIKWKAIENMDRYLLDFETNFTRAGGRVIWANTASEALEELDKLLASYQPSHIATNHAMIHEEIGLPKYLSESKYRADEADFGRYLAQLNGAQPSHVIQPAIALSEDKAKQLWDAKHPEAIPTESSETEEKHEDEEELVTEGSIARMLRGFRKIQRERAKSTDVILSGASYLLADTGSVVISENEGNNRLHDAFATYHIVLAGIDKILPSIHDLDLFLPLGSLHDQGQKLQRHQTLLSGPQRGRETDGPNQMVLILVDNGRSDLLSLTEQRQALYWMECGASTNACAMYETLGGEAYQNTYPGPMGAVFTPHLQPAESDQYLQHAASFKGTEHASPLNIDIDRLLLKNRHDRVSNSAKPLPESSKWTWYTKLVKNRKYVDLIGKGIKNILIKFLFKKSWGEQRALPRIPDKSFSAQWRSKAKDTD
ncbi:LUD domain-containing protein [Sphingobacterium sp. lm-10]|uniref:LUD domain-containing protein n=1 Tax=Sphingobacterium sp. lm-10 TaxID=2944904 RepID=UPI002020D2D6|nr:LUD domain-containing protein [Sphingobacterium sp. lm-10]MCL7989135.1 LUD domain-containing protein [Sphingobacterium sp. lm-10]